MRRSKQIIFALALLLALASCGTSQRVLTQAPMGRSTLSQREFIQKYKSLQEYATVSARGDVTLYGEGGRKEFNLVGIGMRWYLERDRAFELSVRPMSFMEVGKLTVMDDKVLLEDRINKMYYYQSATRRSLGSLITFVGLDPKMAESMIQHRPFGFVDYGVSALERMKFVRDAGGYSFTDELRPGGNRIVHHFDSALNLTSSSLVVVGKGEILVTYSDFVTVGSATGMRPLPSKIQIEGKSIGPSPQHYMVHFALDRIDVDKRQKVSMSPQRGYRSVTLEDIISILSKL